MQPRQLGPGSAWSFYQAPCSEAAVEPAGRTRFGGNQAHLVPEIEFELVFLGDRINAVCFFPELRTDNHKDQDKYNAANQVDHLITGNIEGTVEEQDNGCFKGDGYKPEQHRKEAQAGSPLPRGLFHNLLTIGTGGSLLSGSPGLGFFCRNHGTLNRRFFYYSPFL